MKSDGTIIPTRAKAGWIEGKRKDNGGRIVTAKTNIVPSHGMFSAKEMEGVMRDVAAEVGASEDQIRISTYENGEAPLEVNPRHRGWHNYNKRATKPTEYKNEQPIKVRTVFSGWAAPATPEELEQYIKEFNARWKS